MHPIAATKGETRKAVNSPYPTERTLSIIVHTMVAISTTTYRIREMIINTPIFGAKPIKNRIRGDKS
jgi:hypothetical protein